MSDTKITAQDLGPRDVEQAYLCARCGWCMQACPTFGETGRESMGARGRVQLLRGLIEGQLDLTDNLLRVVYACLGCNACSVNCPSGLDVEELISQARAAIRRKGVELPALLEALRGHLDRHGNPFGLNRAERSVWLPAHLRQPRESETCIHMGCSVSFANNRVGKMILRILDRCGLDFTLMGDDEECCGDPLVRLGETPLAGELQERNKARFRRWGVKRVVTPCAGCVKSLRRHYGEFESLHVVEWIAQLIPEGRIKPQKPLHKRIIYFDACDMGRHAGIYDPPRQILQAIPGVDLIEYDKTRDFGQCCGGPLMSADPEMARSIAAKRVAEALDKGAEIIASACPTCFINLRGGAQRLNNHLAVHDVMSLLYNSLR